VIHGQDCGGIFACHSCHADAWAAGRLRHTDACQIRHDPPEGFPFDSFSCNCNGEPLPAWLAGFPEEVDDWEPVTADLWRGTLRNRVRTWIYAMQSGDRRAAIPVTWEAAEDPGVMAFAIETLRKEVTDRD
jgi:hypothetical protein